MFQTPFLFPLQFLDVMHNLLLTLEFRKAPNVFVDLGRIICLPPAFQVNGIRNRGVFS
jgi:hypothetical protein